ncbi:hypothetical protein EU805_02640 [Salipiger sp. IMCC34102]|uniref:hypothetical protein n=1 Tax=Salipiger sp. IMCC34102 TaxID=2510647 RepID=UPI00101CDE2D|nr:hypothetical protein [Salipiger sp. IMCC34102]RYH04284.1 hypothetical protein EU805_02640 [Salipiger sp. IMCC34102]
MVSRTSFKRLAAPWILSTAFASFALLPAGPVRAQLSADIEPSFATALVRDALAALNQANVTGNYTVLRDYGARGFREANDPTDLAAAFARLRAERLNLMQALIVAPRFRNSSLSLDRSVMRLSGVVPVQGQGIDFDMEFRLENNAWRLQGVSVGPAAAPAPPPASAPPPGGEGAETPDPEAPDTVGDDQE